MKRYLTIVLTILCLVAFMSTPAAAARPEKNYPVTFNGRPILFDVNPEVIPPGISFVPFRAIFEKMGATVDYDGMTNTVSAVRGDITIKLVPGSTTAQVNGSSRTLTAAPFIKDGRTLVPLRFIAEAMGAEVSYDPATTAISIVDKNWPPKRGGTLNLASWNAPEGKFNPIVWSDTYTSDIGGMMYEGLWGYDERFTPIPGIAEHWEWDSTNTKLTFYLRKGLTYFDGTPIKARDVVFAYKAIWHPKYVGPRNTGWEDVKGWEEYTKGIKGETAEDFEKGMVTPSDLEGLYAPDDYTVVFELKQPNAPFLFNVAYGPIDYSSYRYVPVQLWGTARDPNNDYPNGFGPYKMKEFVEGQYYVMEAFDNYWGGKPYIDRVIWRVISTDVAVGEMQLGNLDFSELSAVELEAYQAMSNVKLHEYPDMLYQEMVFNTVKGPTQDKTVRQAIAYAVDRESIIHNLMQDHASTMYTPIHPLTWAYTEDVNKYEYNVAKANQMLDGAGWTKGSDGIRSKGGERLHLRLIYPNVGNPVRQATAPVMQQMLKEIGVEVELVGMDWTAINTVVFEEHDFDMYFIGFQLGNSDPDQTGLWDKQGTAPGAFNASGWWTDKSEELIAKGKATGDIEERMAIYQEWAQHWTEECPAVILYAVNSLYAQNERLQNFKPGPQGKLWNLTELWLSK